MTKRKRRDHNHLVPHQGDPTDLAARLTPLEERRRRGQGNGGAIVVDAAALRLPKDIDEGQGKRGRLFGLEPIGVIILAFAVAFIAFIAYLISIEPQKSDEGPGATIEAGR